MLRQIMRVSLITAAGTVGLFAFLGWSYSYELKPECERVLEWVRSHRSELPRNLDGISRYPLNYRRVIASELPVDDREKLWISHLDKIAQSYALTPAQLAYIKEQQRLIPSILRRKVTADESRMRTEEAANVLGVSLAIQAVRVLGPMPAVARKSFDCECNRFEDYCNVWPGGGDECALVYCQESDSGCGLFGSLSCNGMCL